ncbi:protein catecholamines up-like [Aricia agestis]|uniref:protein catecholamines up-like n=1 Tax=Aricia agestis TaxID=91739 RepID=UPI001C20C308|nr:protein catecholamines up-like [Aricia agestis]
MDCSRLIILACLVAAAAAWSVPYYPVRRPLRVVRYAPLPHHRVPVAPAPTKWDRPKRDHDFVHDHDHHDHNYDHDHGHDHDYDHRNTNGVTGPVHTFVKTDKNANYKWGVRHHVGNKFAP